MSKINISFNNKNYSVDESVFASSATELKTHLSTVMNGSGAVIELDGVSYNIDSTKLTSATNDFVSHLGTIAGSGSKVSVNGVEYSVDSSKIATSVSELETVFGDLNTEGESGVTILPSTTLPFSPYGGDTGVYAFETTEGFDFVKDNQYTVIFDGVTYKCTVKSIQYTIEGVTAEIFYAGNGDIVKMVVNDFDFESSSEPFVLVKAGHFAIMTTSADAYHTIEILG